MGAVIRGGEKERKREKKRSRARRRHGDRDRAERTYEPRGGETRVDKDDGMKEREATTYTAPRDGGENWEK